MLCNQTFIDKDSDIELSKVLQEEKIEWVEISV